MRAGWRGFSLRLERFLLTRVSFDEAGDTPTARDRLSTAM
jgi:hypothetical protein